MLMSHETILAAIFVASACLVGKTGEPEATTQGTMGPKSLKTEVPKKFKIVILGPTVKTEVATYYLCLRIIRLSADMDI